MEKRADMLVHNTHGVEYIYIHTHFLTKGYILLLFAKILSE